MPTTPVLLEKEILRMTGFWYAALQPSLPLKQIMAAVAYMIPE